MKKNLVLKISFILILTIMFLMFSMNVAAVVTIKENSVPLAGAVFEFDDSEEAAEISPKTGDLTIQSSILTVILAGTAGIIFAKRRKFI